MYVQVNLTIKGETISCRGLLDTGNQLYEPITRIPVTIMDLDLFQNILPKNIYESVKQLKDYQVQADFLEMDDEWLQRIRMIPFRSVSRGMDLLVALRPDKITIVTNNGCFETSKVLVGLNPVALSSDASYQAIVHPRVTDEEYQLEAEKVTDKPKQAM